MTQEIIAYFFAIALIMAIIMTAKIGRVTPTVEIIKQYFIPIPNLCLILKKE